MEKTTMRRTRRVILNENQAIEDLDLWPGDEVWFHDGFVLLGRVNSHGQFVTQLDTLN